MSIEANCRWNFNTESNGLSRLTTLADSNFHSSLNEFGTHITCQLIGIIILYSCNWCHGHKEINLVCILVFIRRKGSKHLGGALRMADPCEVFSTSGFDLIVNDGWNVILTKFLETEIEECLLILIGIDVRIFP